MSAQISTGAVTSPPLEDIERRCTKCEETKPLAQFHRDRGGKGGYKALCKVCQKEYNRLYRALNTDKVHEYQQAYYHAHHDYLLEQRRGYAAENREALLEKKRKYIAANREKESARVIQWQKDNKERVRVKHKVRRVTKRGNGGCFTREEWLALCDKYDNRCLACGSQTSLEPDHIVPVALGGSGDIDNIQPLCRPCNASKGARVIDYREQHDHI